MRLDKALAHSGLTRSQAKKAVAQGRVRVKGIPARDAAADAEPCDVTLDFSPIEVPREIHLMLNKPAGYLTATEDSRDRTILALLPEEYLGQGLGPVGRLDKDVTGLILLTTDGQLAHRLISPKRMVEKVYEAHVEGDICRIGRGTGARGNRIQGLYRAFRATVEILSPDSIRLTLTEGKYHEVKRICARVGHPVIALRRVSIGGIRLDPAPRGGQFPGTDAGGSCLNYTRFRAWRRKNERALLHEGAFLRA